MTEIPDTSRIRRQVLLALAVVVGGYLVLSRLGLDDEPIPAYHPRTTDLQLDRSFHHGASFCLDDLSRRLEADSSVLEKLIQRNFREITLILPVWLPSVQSGHLEYPSCDPKRAGSLGTRLREKGFTVTFRPWIWTGGGRDAASVLETDHAGIFQRSYREFILELAPEAAKGADVLVLNAFGFQSHRGASAWLEMVSTARTSFSGALAYVFSDSLQVQRFVFWNSIDVAVLEGPAIPRFPKLLHQWRVPSGLAIDLGTSLPPLHHILSDLVTAPASSGPIWNMDTLELPPTTRCVTVPEGRTIPSYRRSKELDTGLDSWRPPESEIRSAGRNQD